MGVWWHYLTWLSHPCFPALGNRRVACFPARGSGRTIPLWVLIGSQFRPTMAMVNRVSPPSILCYWINRDYVEWRLIIPRKNRIAKIPGLQTLVLSGRKQTKQKTKKLTSSGLVFWSLIKSFNWFCLMYEVLTQTVRKMPFLTKKKKTPSSVLTSTTTVNVGWWTARICSSENLVASLCSHSKNHEKPLAYHVKLMSNFWKQRARNSSSRVPLRPVIL